MLDLSIVSINHHHRGMIERCLDSLAGLPDRASFEVVVIDNTPEDGLSEWVNGRYPNVSIRTNPATLGYAANANRGIRTAATGRYAMMINPDVVCSPGLLDRLVSFMDGHPSAAVAGPGLLNRDGSLQDSCRRFPTPLTLALRFTRLDGILGRTNLMKQYLMKDWDHASTTEVDWVTGAVMILRREALQAIGCFDETYFMYWEDLDLCLRLWHAGWRICYVPDARATHAHLRQGVRNPFSQFAQWQISGAVKIFQRFGTAPTRQIRPA